MQNRLLPSLAFLTALLAGAACSVERKSGDAESADASRTDSAAGALDSNDISFPSDSLGANDVVATPEVRGDTSWRAAAEAHRRRMRPDAPAAVVPPPVALPDSESLAGLVPERVNARATRPAYGGEGATVLRAQILLDRAGFSTGAIDGSWGANTSKAVYWYQDANGLPVSGFVDQRTFAHLERAVGSRAALARYTLSADDAAARTVPLGDTPYAQAEQPCLCYESTWEMLAERFHTTRELLARLNPGVDTTRLAAGTQLWVPNVERQQVVPLVSDPVAARLANATPQQIRERAGAAEPTMAGGARGPAAGDSGAAAGASPMVDSLAPVAQPAVARIVVSKKGSYLHAYDASGRLLLHAPNTLGSSYDPSPDEGAYRVTRVVFYPSYHYNPKLFSQVPDSKPEARLPAGPNSPVGAVWMALSKPHYGIHGTHSPQTIGYAQSAGCVRLTNWDVRWLAEHTPAGVTVEFVE